MRRACWRCRSFGTSPLFGAMTAGRWLADYIGHEVRRHQHVLEALLADQQWQRWKRGAASGGGTVWRHGCRHRASRDGFTACPDTGCGAAPPTTSAHRSICAEHLSFTRECFGLLRRLHAYRCGTRRKYVRVGSGAASMPLKVPHRHPRKHHRLLSVTERNAGACWAAGGPNRTVTTGLLTWFGLELDRARSDMPRSLTASTARAAAP
ncbi:hypothetical protein FHR64_002755 [Xanthomonas arboricola]|nr:hypothetical protein [Xanthomonas arboricola]